MTDENGAEAIPEWVVLEVGRLYLLHKHAQDALEKERRDARKAEGDDSGDE